MGRYVEKDVDLGGNALTDWNSRLFKQADGSFLLADNSGFVLRSTDGGASWTRENLPWLVKMKEEDKYIRTMAFGLDGTAAVVWTEPEEGSGEDGNGVQLKPDMQLTLVKPDGTQILADVKTEPKICGSTASISQTTVGSLPPRRVQTCMRSGRTEARRDT